MNNIVSKRGLTSTVLMMILMSIFMVGIIIFGLNKLLVVEETISAQESLEAQEKIRENFEYCDNPLNAQSITNFEIDIEGVNAVCILGDDLGVLSEFDELIQIKEGGDNIVLLNAFFEETPSQTYQYNSIQVLDSFSVNYKDLETTLCFTDENTNTLRVSLSCSK